jgi:ubiquinone/menaquinone biosynthesis C-methylase UbiE
MDRALLVVGVAAGLIILAGVVWRRVSTRRAAPCPAWLVPLLENPYVEALASARILIDRAAVEPAMRVLDVGSGPGRLTLPLAEQVGTEGTVVALDIQPQMLDRLQQRLEDRGLGNVQTMLGGVGQGDLEADDFDRAFLVTVLGEIVEKEKAMEEIHAALKRGGLLSVTEVFPDPHYQSRKRVRELAEAAGFRLQAQFGTWLAFTLNFRKEPAADPEEAVA